MSARFFQYFSQDETCGNNHPSVALVARRFQRETLKASAFEGMYQEASAAMACLQEEVEQRQADAKILAQEVGMYSNISSLDCPCGFLYYSRASRGASPCTVGTSRVFALIIFRVLRRKLSC